MCQNHFCQSFFRKTPPCSGDSDRTAGLLPPSSTNSFSLFQAQDSDWLCQALFVGFQADWVFVFLPNLWGYCAHVKNFAPSDAGVGSSVQGLMATCVKAGWLSVKRR